MPAEIWRTVTLKNIIHHTGPQSEKKMKRKYREVGREGDDCVVIMFGGDIWSEADCCIINIQTQDVLPPSPPCTKHLVNIFYLLCNFPGRIPHTMFDLLP